MPIVKCPTCGKQTEWNGNEYRPFCSQRCKLIDFGAWANEEYRVPDETQEIKTSEDTEESSPRSHEEESMN
jgi:endogenous inhibitor of DNA gyrase (YacG/DUF329 family)